MRGLFSPRVLTMCAAVFSSGIDSGKTIIALKIRFIYSNIHTILRETIHLSLLEIVLRESLYADPESAFSSKKSAFKKMDVPTNMAFCPTVACSGKVTSKAFASVKISVLRLLGIFRIFPKCGASPPSVLAWLAAINHCKRGTR